MPAVPIDLEWQRDSRGYCIATPERREVNPYVITSGLPESDRIAPVGGEPIAYRPLDQFDRLFTRFSQIKTPAELLMFVQRYGMLTVAWEHRRQGENIDLTLEQARNMRRVIATATKFDVMVRVPGISAILAPAGKGKYGFRFSVTNLLCGLWLQAGLAISGDLQFRQCLHCQKLFEVGATSRPRRRLDAQYCSPAHQERHKSLRRSL